MEIRLIVGSSSAAALLLGNPGVAVITGQNPRAKLLQNWA